jgi:uncharacterized membrane protein YuzA (DUF378 family)
MKILRLRSLRTVLPSGLLLASMVMGLNAAPLVVSACPTIKNTDPNSSQNQVLTGVGSDACNSNGVNGDNGVISTVVNILSIVVGVAAIIMILVSAFKYITSNGDSAKIGSAKTTLIYALVGLAIAGLAEAIVHLVLVQSTQATLPTCKSDPSLKPPACQ